MAGQVLNDLLNANIERVRTGVLPRIYQLNKEYAVQRVMGNTETYRITKTTNGADFRAPIELAPPGVYGAANLDGGALGPGVGFAIAQFLQTFFETKMGFQLSYRAAKGTSTPEQSVLNAWKRTMEEGLPNMAAYEDISWHNLGGQDGQIGVVKSVSGGSPGVAGTFTMDVDMGARMLLPNMRFEIVDSAGAVWKTSGVSPDSLPYFNPGAVQYQGATASYTCPTTLTGGNVPAAGDVLYFQGAIAAGPTASWLQGLRYVNTTTTSGNYLGVSRSTYPVINSSVISTGGTLTPEMCLALLQLIRIRSGNNQVPSNLVGLVGPHQIAIMNETVQAMQAFYRTQATEKMLDPLPQVMLDGGIVWGGQTHYYDSKQSSTRIDYCNPPDWGRVYYDDKPGADFYRRLGDGQMFFDQVSTTNGTPLTTTLFYLISTLNYYNINPQNSGLITNLTAPAVNYNF